MEDLITRGTDMDFMWKKGGLQSEVGKDLFFMHLTDISSRFADADLEEVFYGRMIFFGLTLS